MPVMAHLHMRSMLIATFLVVSLVTATAEAGLGTWTSGGPGAGPINAVAIAPRSPSTVYAGSVSGIVFKSTDGGATWFFASAGITTTSIQSLAIDPITPATVYAGTAGTGVFKTVNGGASWTPVNNGLFDGVNFFNGTINAIAIDPTSPSKIYAATQGFGVFKSLDGGANWTAANAGFGVIQFPSQPLFVRALVIDPVTPSILYAGTTQRSVFKSTDGGDTWSPANNGIQTASPISMAIDAQSPSTLYAGLLLGAVFKSINAGASWTVATLGLPAASIPALAVDPHTSSTVYAGTADGVYVSADAGGSWAAFNTGLPRTQARALAITPDGGCIHVGMIEGVFDFEARPGSCAPLVTLVAAVLPGSRSVQVGNVATVFATIINTGAAMARQVGISLVTPVPASFQYNQTDCATNSVIGAAGVPVDIAAGDKACYVISITPSGPFDPLDLVFGFAGANTAPVAPIPGINTLLLSASAGPVADIVALSATPSLDGILDIAGVPGTGVFAVATTDVGAAATITVSADTGNAGLPLGLTMCRVHTACSCGLNGAKPCGPNEEPVCDDTCDAPLTPTLTVSYGHLAAISYYVFAGTLTPIPLDPAVNRIFVRFRDGSGAIRGETSVAVEAQ